MQFTGGPGTSARANRGARSPARVAVAISVRSRRVPGTGYTPDCLRRAADFARAAHGGARSDGALLRKIEDFRTNRYDERSGTLRLTAEQPQAHRQLIGHYSRFFSEPTTKHGLRKEAINDRGELAQLTAFFGWTAWAASAERPGHNYTS